MLTGLRIEAFVATMRSALTLSLVLLVLLASAFGRSPESSKSTTGSDAGHQLRDTLTNMEKELAQAEQQKNKRFFDQALSPQFLMVAYNGLVFTKAELLSKLNYLDVKRYAMKNFKVRLIGQAGALLTYDLDIQASAAGQHAPAKQYASSVWLKQGSHWQLLFHQSTPAAH